MQPPSVDALVVASDHAGTIPRFEEKKFTALLVICLSSVIFGLRPCEAFLVP